jgi:hypothetical protein
MRFAALRSLLSRFTRPELLALGTLVLVFVVLAVRSPFVPGLAWEWRIHSGILVALLAFVGLAHRGRSSDFWVVVRPLGALGVMFALYFSLATVPFEAIPWEADGLLFDLDRLLFGGVSPALWLDGRLDSRHVELFSFCYALFIPYLYLSVVVGILGREHRERERLFAALVMLYALAFVGYLFAPARGPVVFLADQLEPLAGGFFHGQVLNAVEASGGPHGAMPSLHLGISLLVCVFDLKVNRLRGLIYIPLVLGILFATVSLRYHWVVDLLVGALLAGLALRYSKGLVDSAPPAGGRS